MIVPLKMKYSFIVPTYNSERWIQPCINSILSQSYTDFNLLILDSGSTDQTLNWIGSVNDSRIIDEVAFSRMDIRLAHKLVELSNGADSITVTQQQLAAELGSAREVISRILAEFQRRGLVSLSRGVITINERQALEKPPHL